MSMFLPKVYPILDDSFLPAENRTAFLDRLGRSLADAGVQMLEYRNKTGTDADVLADALILRAAMPANQVRLVMDDRVDVAMAAGFDGVHVDGGDLPPSIARQLMGTGATIGTSASNEVELLRALGSGADYVAFGPVFATATKQTTAELIGVAGVGRFRAIAGPPHDRLPALVAAAGITLETARQILAAGADTVAVAAAIFRCDDPAAEFARWIKELR